MTLGQIHSKTSKEKLRLRREIHANRAKIAQGKRLKNCKSLIINVFIFGIGNAVLAAGAAMRTLLRNVTTGAYFGGADKWTMDPESAVDFKMIDRALAFIEQWRLKDVEIAFAFRKGSVKRVSPEKLRISYAE